MNKKQKACLLVGMAVIVVMGLFPPWVLETEKRNYLGNKRFEVKYTTEPGPYSWIGNPPREPAEYETERVWDWDKAIWLSDVKEYKKPIPTKYKTEMVKPAVEVRFIDLYRLGLQYFVVAVVTAGLIIILGDKNRPAQG